MKKFLSVILLCFPVVVFGQNTALQCTAPKHTVGKKVKFVSNVYQPSQEFGDTSELFSGPEYWTDTVLEISDHEMKSIRVNEETGRRIEVGFINYPNEMSIYSFGSSVAPEGSRDVVFPLFQGKKWEHKYYRRQGDGGSDEITVKVEVVKVENKNGDIICTISRNTGIVKFGGEIIPERVAKQIWSQNKGWYEEYNTYWFETKKYTTAKYN